VRDLNGNRIDLPHDRVRFHDDARIDSPDARVKGSQHKQGHCVHQCHRRKNVVDLDGALVPFEDIFPLSFLKEFWGYITMFLSLLFGTIVADPSAPSITASHASLLLDGAIAPWDATLQLHHPATSVQFNARCLDGSKGGLVVFWSLPQTHKPTLLMIHTVGTQVLLSSSKLSGSKKQVEVPFRRWWMVQQSSKLRL